MPWKTDGPCSHIHFTLLYLGFYLFQRIPTKMLEAKCLCPHRPAGMGLECEGVRMSQKVLKFDSSCDGYRYAEDVIQLGCVAVLSVTRKIPITPNVDVLLEPPIET